MTAPPKSGWPRTPNGAIDWETAFEDPQTGFIPLILQARTSPALRECMVAIVTRLYVRKDDPSEVENFVAQLSAILPAQASPRQLSRIADMMVSILRRIKADRIRLAAAATPEAAKASVPATSPAVAVDAPAPVDERRSKSESASLAALTRAAIARRLRNILLVAGGIAGTLVIAGIMIDAYIEGAPQREAKRNAALLLDQIQAAGRGESAGPHVFGGNIRVEWTGDRASVVVEGLSPDQCANAGWMLAKSGGISVDGFAPSNLSLNALRALCANNPGDRVLKWTPRADDRQRGSAAKK